MHDTLKIEDYTEVNKEITSAGFTEFNGMYGYKSKDLGQYDDITEPTIILTNNNTPVARVYSKNNRGNHTRLDWYTTEENITDDEIDDIKYLARKECERLQINDTRDQNTYIDNRLTQRLLGYSFNELLESYVVSNTCDIIPEVIINTENFLGVKYYHDGWRRFHESDFILKVGEKVIINKLFKDTWSKTHHIRDGLAIPGNVNHINNLSDKNKSVLKEACAWYQWFCQQTKESPQPVDETRGGSQNLNYEVRWLCDSIIYNKDTGDIKYIQIPNLRCNLDGYMYDDTHFSMFQHPADSDPTV